MSNSMMMQPYFFIWMLLLIGWRLTVGSWQK